MAHDKTNGLSVRDKEALKVQWCASVIKAGAHYRNAPQILWVDEAVIATFGNFSASTGKAKSRKTFNVSAIVAAALTNGQVLRYRASLPESKQRILYVDTEQSRYHCQLVLKRILRMAGLPAESDCDRLDFLCLREYAPATRVALIDYALSTRGGYGLVVIDGIRDLLFDINNAAESVEVIGLLMRWSSCYDLHIHCVLHLNKSDDNTRGHIGTELNNKAESVLLISKNYQTPDVSTVRPIYLRDKEFETFSFIIDEAGYPALTETHGQTTYKARTLFTDLPDEVHHSALEKAFAAGPIKGFEMAVQTIGAGYAASGFVRSRSVLAKLLLYLIREKHMISKQDRYYLYVPHLNKATLP